MAHSGVLLSEGTPTVKSGLKKSLCYAMLLFITVTICGAVSTASARSHKRSHSRHSQKRNSNTRPRRVSNQKCEKLINAAVVEEDNASSDSTSVALYMPIATGKLSSEYGVRRPRHNHAGVDIAAPHGTPIEAAAAGIVIFSGWCNGYGNTIVLEHADGLTTRYAHASQLLVAEGNVVQLGQQIALVGSTGRSTGAHLHFEVTENGRRLNPLHVVHEELASKQAEEKQEFIRATYNPDLY